MPKKLLLRRTPKPIVSSSSSASGGKVPWVTEQCDLQTVPKAVQKIVVSTRPVVRVKKLNNCTKEIKIYCQTKVRKYKRASDRKKCSNIEDE
jgi:hypothetical protein